MDEVMQTHTKGTGPVHTDATSNRFGRRPVLHRREHEKLNLHSNPQLALAKRRR